MSAQTLPFITVITGTMVYILGQLSLKIVIEPYIEQQKVISDIAYSIVYYNDAFCTNDEDKQYKHIDEKILEARQKYRALASQLVTTNQFIKGYGLWRYVLSAPSRSKIHDAALALLQLSDSIRNPIDPTVRIASIDNITISLAIHLIEAGGSGYDQS